MSLSVITPPRPVVNLDEAKHHLRVEHDDDDAYIADLVEVAQGTIDGPDGWLGRSLGVQTLELRAPCFEGFTGGGLVLPCGPIVEVLAVSYLAAGGALATLDPSAYELAGSDLAAASGLMWPSVQLRADAVRVRYRAGYLKTADDPPRATLPAPIRHAILLMVGDLYANRESGGTGPAYSAYKMPTTIENLLVPFRVW